MCLQANETRSSIDTKQALSIEPSACFVLCLVNLTQSNIEGFKPSPGDTNTNGHATRLSYAKDTGLIDHMRSYL